MLLWLMIYNIKRYTHVLLQAQCEFHVHQSEMCTLFKFIVEIHTALVLWCIHLYIRI